MTEPETVEGRNLVRWLDRALGDQADRDLVRRSVTEIERQARTDRASAEELREAVLVEFEKHKAAHGESCDCDLGIVLGDLSDAALRDTGPHPEPIATLSLYEQGRRQTLMDLGFDIDGIDTATAVEAARDVLAALRDTGPRPDSEGPWRDDQGYWLGGMGTPDTGPRPDSGIDAAFAFLRKRLVGTPPNVDSEDAWMASLLDEAESLARLSTPRTETSDTVRIGSKTYLAGSDDD